MYLHQIPRRLTMLAAALVACLPALAQQAAPVAPVKKADAPMQKIEVKGSAEAYDARRDDTATKIVMNAEEIVKYGDTSVLDVMKRLPGVTVSGASGRGGEVRMRGLGAGYTQILVNGERAPAGFSMESLSPDSIERIEVIRAATAEFSTQSIAGTINIVLKKAVKAAQREIKIGMGAGKGLLAPNYNLSLSDRKGQLSYSLSVNGFHNRFKRDSPSTEEGVDKDGAPILRHISFHEDGGFDGINIGPRLNWTFDNGDTLTSQSFINFGRFARDSVSNVETIQGGAPFYPYVDWSVANENLFFRTDLNWVKKLGDGAKLDLKVGAVTGALRNDSYRLGYSQKGGLFKLDNYVKSRGTDTGYTSTGKYSTPLFEGHSLAMGWDAGYSTRDDRRTQHELALPNGFAPSNTDEKFTGDVTRFAGYMQDEWNVTKAWSVYFGIRWEGISTAVSGDGFVDSKSSSSVFSPLFQTLYKLPNTKGDQLRFALTRTYKAPGTQALIPRRFTNANNSQAEPDFQGNPDLKPELAIGLDASYEHYFGEGAMFSISASARQIDDYTTNKVEKAPDGKWISKLANKGQANTRGIEFDAKFPLKAVMKDAPAIDLRINFSRNWSDVEEVLDPNNRLDSQTPFSSTLGIDYKAGKLTTGGSFSFRNGGPVTLALDGDRSYLRSYQSVRRDLELYGLWKFDPKNQLRVVFTNVLAQDYLNETTTFNKGEGTLRRASVFPGDVSVRATMEMKF
ncbi:MAG: TonB-dependent receptor [Pseudomonadota bacterium]